jgi:hypothetical protein
MTPFRYRDQLLHLLRNDFLYGDRANYSNATIAFVLHDGNETYVYKTTFRQGLNFIICGEPQRNLSFKEMASAGITSADALVIASRDVNPKVPFYPQRFPFRAGLGVRV